MWSEAEGEIRNKKWRVNEKLPDALVGKGYANIYKIDDNYFGRKRIDTDSNKLYYAKIDKDFNVLFETEVAGAGDFPLNPADYTPYGGGIGIDGDTIVLSCLTIEDGSEISLTFGGLYWIISIDGGLTWGAPQRDALSVAQYRGDCTSQINKYGAFWHAPYWVYETGIAAGFRTLYWYTWKLDGTGTVTNISRSIAYRQEVGGGTRANPTLNEPSAAHFGGGQWLMVAQSLWHGDGSWLLYSEDNGANWTLSGRIGQSVNYQHVNPGIGIASIDLKPTVILPLRSEHVGLLLQGEAFDSVKTNPQFGFNLLTIVNPSLYQKTNQFSQMERDPGYTGLVEFDDRIVLNMGKFGQLYDIRPSDLDRGRYRGMVITDRVPIPTDRQILIDTFTRLKESELLSFISPMDCIDIGFGSPSIIEYRLTNSANEVPSVRFDDSQTEIVGSTVWLKRNAGKVTIRFKALMDQAQADATKTVRLGINFHKYTDGILNTATLIEGGTTDITVPEPAKTIFSGGRSFTLGEDVMGVTVACYGASGTATGDVVLLGVEVNDFYDENQKIYDQYNTPLGAIPVFRYFVRNTVDGTDDFVMIKLAPTEGYSERSYFNSAVSDSLLTTEPGILAGYPSQYDVEGWGFGLYLWYRDQVPTPMGFYAKGEGNLISGGEFQIGYIFK